MSLGVILGTVGCSSLSYPSTPTSLPSTPTPPQDLGAEDWLIVVSLAQQELYLYRGPRLVATYSVSTGEPASPTPVGRWQISAKLVDPGPGTQFGTRWMSLSQFNPETGVYDGTDYGIHGTDEEDKIGRPVSAGCVRMINRDIEDLFELVPLGTEVITLR